MYFFLEDGILMLLFGMLEKVKLKLLTIIIKGKPEKSLYGPLICGDGIDNTDTYILTASYSN